MRAPTAYLIVGIVAAAISMVSSGPVYAGQVSGSPFALLSTSTPATSPHAVLVKGGGGGGGGGGGKHHGMKAHHGNWNGHHRRSWRHGRYYYTPTYCSNWVWDGYEYKCYDDYDDF